MSHRLLAALPLALLIGPALPQHGHAPSATPYAGLERRTVKSLSDEQIADLRAGRGMGLALPAELNGYPGPVHVLEHAASLELAPEQRARVEALYEAMKREAVPLGERLIAQEADLDALFADHTITPDGLARATAAIGQTQAALRAAHLKYHLAMMDVLSPAQVSRYAELRGYGGGVQPSQPGHKGRH
jgi:hypothetical protein